jgi:hypothetical protein
VPTSSEFLTPVLGLVGWTFVMWFWMYATRLPAMKAASIRKAATGHLAHRCRRPPAGGG